MTQDRYGLPLSTASAAAGRAYVDGVDRFRRAGRAADAQALLARRIDRRPSVPVAGA